MDLPDDLILKRIQKNKVYCDWKSKESNTGAIGKKYKLAGNIIEEFSIYTFFSITKSLTSNRNFNLEVKQSEWENRDERFLDKPISYIDIRRVEAIDKEELLSKIKDCRNKFPRVAVLCSNKCQELENIKQRVRRLGCFIPSDVLTLIDVAIGDISKVSVDGIVNQLGLD